MPPCVHEAKAFQSLSPSQAALIKYFPKAVYRSQSAERKLLGRYWARSGQQCLCLNTVAVYGLICRLYSDGRAQRISPWQKHLDLVGPSSHIDARKEKPSRIHVLNHRTVCPYISFSSSFSLFRGKMHISWFSSSQIQVPMPIPLRLAVISERSRIKMLCSPYQRLVEMAEATWNWQRRSRDELTFLLIHSSRPRFLFHLYHCVDRDGWCILWTLLVLLHIKCMWDYC